MSRQTWAQAVLALGRNAFGWRRQSIREALSVPGAEVAVCFIAGVESIGCLERQSDGGWLRDLYSTTMSPSGFKGPRNQVITDTGYREE